MGRGREERCGEPIQAPAGAQPPACRSFNFQLTSEHVSIMCADPEYVALSHKSDLNLGLKGKGVTFQVNSPPCYTETDLFHFLCVCF